MKTRIALLVVALGLVAGAAVAHHSTAGIYEPTLEVQLKGTVKEWRFINPHPSLKIDVVDEKGVTHEWDVSYGGNAVAHLKRRGYSATTFKVGDVILVKGHPTVLKDAYGLLMEMGNPTREDGKPYP
jgi:hypothetical protein